MLATLTTYLIVEPEEGSGSEPLRVAVVGDLRTEPLLRPDGTAPVDATVLAQISAAADALAETDTPASFAVTPELVETLSADPRPESRHRAAGPAPPRARPRLARPALHNGLLAGAGGRGALRPARRPNGAGHQRVARRARCGASTGHLAARSRTRGRGTRPPRTRRVHQPAPRSRFAERQRRVGQ